MAYSIERHTWTLEVASTTLHPHAGNMAKANISCLVADYRTAGEPIIIGCLVSEHLGIDASMLLEQN